MSNRFNLIDWGSNALSTVFGINDDQCGSVQDREEDNDVDLLLEDARVAFQLPDQRCWI